MAVTSNTRRIGPLTTDWSQTLTFTTADLGASSTTQQFTANVTASLIASATVFSSETAVSSFYEIATGYNDVGSALATPSTILSATGIAPVFYSVDSVDFGRAYPTNTGSAAASGSFTGQFYGAGLLNVPAYGLAAIHAVGPGNMYAVFTTQSSTTVQVTPRTTVDSISTLAPVTGATPVAAASYTPSGALTTAGQVVRLADATTGWSSGFAVNGFDQELGQLQAIRIRIAVTGTGSYYANSQEPVDSSINVDQAATISLSAGANALASATSTSATGQMLPGSYTPLTSAPIFHGYTPQFQDTYVTDAASLAAFTTAGSVALTAKGSGSTTVAGPGNFSVQTTLTDGAVISVNYLYVAAPAVTASATSGFLASSAAALSGTAPADPLVDASYYDAQLGVTPPPDPVAAAEQASFSYANGGWQQGLNPDALFDTGYYLAHNKDVAAAGVNPLLHYETYGWKEGRDPSAAFSTDKYLAAYPDVRAAGVNPLLQYINDGQVQGRTAFTA